MVYALEAAARKLKHQHKDSVGTSVLRIGGCSRELSEYINIGITISIVNRIILGGT